MQRTAKGDVRLGGHLTLAESRMPGSIAPDRITDAVSSRIGTQVHCGLLRLDASSLKVIPGIAESWSVDDKGTSYVFRLRKGVQFQEDACFGNSSREITANDFVYSFKKLCGPDGGEAFFTTFKGRVMGADAFHNGDTDRLKGVQAIDDYTLRIEMTKADPSFLFVLAQPSTAVISEKASEKYGKDARVGAGPFKLTSHDSVWVLVRNTDYFQHDAFGNRLPYVDTLTIRFMPDKEQQLDAFFNDGLDIVTQLYLDPVRSILEQHVSEFSGQRPRYILQREPASAGHDSYCMVKARVKGFTDNFMGYRDYAQLQVVQ